jgi:3-oxoacyl-[acyl-carrier-protein] synthase III
MQEHMKVGIKKIEYYLAPEKENGQVLLRENPDWVIEKIEKTTGIKTRHLAGSLSVVDLAERAAEKLFESSIDSESIDFLVLVTQSPLNILPASACLLHNKLKLNSSCLSFDVNLGCSGYVYALALCGSLIEAGIVRQGLIICSETYSKYIDPKDRTCRPLFSDAAAASLIARTTDDTLGPFEMGTEGGGYNNVIVRSDEDTVGLDFNKLFMNGGKVFMFTMNMVPKCVNALLEKSEITIHDVDLYIFHQASKLIIDNLIRRLKIPPDKVFINYETIGNTVSASIPIAMKQAIEEGKMHKGDNVMLVGFGVGYSWGACMLKYDGES